MFEYSFAQTFEHIEHIEQIDLTNSAVSSANAYTSAIFQISFFSYSIPSRVFFRRQCNDTIFFQCNLQTRVQINHGKRKRREKYVPVDVWTENLTPVRISTFLCALSVHFGRVKCEPVVLDYRLTPLCRGIGKRDMKAIIPCINYALRFCYQLLVDCLRRVKVG